MKKKTLIFHVGYNAGFYSEYLEMISAIVYCELNQINFKLFSKDANFANKKGWTDFFEPFCEEVNDEFHSRYNMRFEFPPLVKMLYKKFYKKQPIPTWYWNKFSWWYLNVFITAPYYKFKYRFNYYTHNLWHNIQKTKQENSKQYRDLQYKILNETWKFNLETKNEIEDIIQNLNLPEKYIGTQIRAGDKSDEQAVFGFKEYMDRIISLKSGIFDLFVFTDDYLIITNMRKCYPEYRIFTLCDVDEQGYNNEKFQNQSSIVKRGKLLSLFASVEILWKSELLVGAINANPSLFLYNRQHHNSHWLNAE